MDHAPHMATAGLAQRRVPKVSLTPQYSPYAVIASRVEPPVLQRQPLPTEVFLTLR